MPNVGEIILSTLIILVFFLLIFLDILRKIPWWLIKKTRHRDLAGLHMRKKRKLAFWGKSKMVITTDNKVTIKRNLRQYHKLVIFNGAFLRGSDFRSIFT